MPNSEIFQNLFNRTRKNLRTSKIARSKKLHWWICTNNNWSNRRRWKALKSTNQEIINKAVENLQNAIDNAVEIDLNKIIEIKDKNLKLSLQQELGLPGEIRLGDIRELTSLTVNNKQIQSLEGLQYAVNLESLNIQNNEIKDLSPLKDLKKLTNLKADSQSIYEDWVWAKDKKVSLDYNIINMKWWKISANIYSDKRQYEHGKRQL